MKIYGQHAIEHAEKNPLRKFKIFHGSLEEYNELNLTCQFELSNDCFLEVDEPYVESSFKDFLYHDKIILLDSIMDPKNLGAIIRTAAALGFYVILRKHKGCPVNATVIKCASGGVDNTKIISLSNINTNIQTLKNHGFWCVGLHESGDQDIANYKFKKQTVIVIGGEDKGISDLIKKEIDDLLVINTNNFSTLNASVASSISMFAYNIKV